MPQWFDPLKETPEGRLLKQVRGLMESLGIEKGLDPARSRRIKSSLDDEKRGLAAMTEPRDKVTRGDVIAAAKKNEGKGTSGDKAGGCMKGMCMKGRDCPTCNPKKQLKKFDASDNCVTCGANPHEECRMPGVDHQAINCKLNPVSYDSRFDDRREENLAEHIDEGHGMRRDPDQPMPMILRGEKEQFNCDRCGKTDPSGVGKHGYCSECAREGMAGKGVKKSEVESAMQNGVPQYLDIAGGEPARATSYTTNQRYIAVEDGPKATSISEVFKMPSVSQTGYGPTGSTLHMHINDGGNSGNLPNRAPIEESLADLKKGLTYGQEGVVAEIVDLLEQVYSRL